MFYDYRSNLFQIFEDNNDKTIKVARIIFCGIINGVRRRREGTEGGLWPVLGGGGGGV